MIGYRVGDIVRRLFGCDFNFGTTLMPTVPRDLIDAVTVGGENGYHTESRNLVGSKLGCFPRVVVNHFRIERGKHPVPPVS